MIDQFRYNWLLDHQDEYNCSLFGTVDWSKHGTPNRVFGVVCAICGIFGIVPYVFCLPIMWNMRKQPCYKLMLYLGVNDILLLICICFFAGAIFAKGEVYCHHPKLHFSMCMFAFFCFFSSCFTCFLIALNRFTELLQIRWLHQIYEAGRTNFHVVAAAAYGLYAALFTPIAFFNSDLHIVHFNPMISDRYEYANILHATNNMLWPTASGLLYFVMIVKVAMSKKQVSDEASSRANQAAVMLSLQCGVIVCVHMATCLGYLFLQFIPSLDAIRYMAHLGWMMLHGLPPYIYFALNSALRRRFIEMALPIPSRTMSSTINILR